MSMGRVRIIAWLMTLGALALVAIRSGSSRPSAPEVSPQAQVPTSAEPPQLFRLAGPLEPVPAMRNPSEPRSAQNVNHSTAPQSRPTTSPSSLTTHSFRAHSFKPRDANSLSASVIREPGAASPKIASAIREPKKYALGPAATPRDRATPTLPMDLLLKGPLREEAPLAPRAAKQVPAVQEINAAPPATLPIFSTDNPAMQPVHDRAREHVLRGFSLGERNALYAARTEFIQALRTVAQAVDAQAGLGPQDPQACSQSLARGLNALVEAEDFAPLGGRMDGDLDLKTLIEAHRTPAGKKTQPKTQLAALQMYFDYAREQLSRAAAASPVASQALTGLGKTYTADRAGSPIANAKAMVFHQAAVATDPNNHLASNELGVLLARHGQWDQAKQSLLASLRSRPDAAAWQNLAAVHARLGETELARLALDERQKLVGGELPNIAPAVDGKPTVQWVDPKAFAGPPEEGLASPAKTTSQPTAKPAQAVTAQNSDGWSWIPWK